MIIFQISAEELDFIRQNPTLWNIHSVLNVLYSLVDKSNINLQLEVGKQFGIEKLV